MVFRLPVQADAGTERGGSSGIRNVRDVVIARFHLTCPCAFASHFLKVVEAIWEDAQHTGRTCRTSCGPERLAPERTRQLEDSCATTHPSSPLPCWLPAAAPGPRPLLPRRPPRCQALSASPSAE